jgi:hypothetical protein
MVVVAIVALDFGIIRAMPVIGRPTSVLLVLGALPMANVLAVILLIGQRRREDRQFRLGFVSFGAIALALFVAITWFNPVEMAICFTPLLDYVVKTIGSGRPLLSVAAQALALVVTVGLPQVVFALISGFLCRKFMSTIRIFKRPDRTLA